MSCTDPLPLDVLKSIRTVVTHRGCPDGTAAACIVRAALGQEVAVVAVDYGSRLHLALPAEPGMLFVDMTPPAERIAEFVAAGVAILDHHPTQRQLTLAAGPLGRYADAETDPGVSGAMLAYRCVYEPSDPPPKSATTDPGHTARSCAWQNLAYLTGIRDTWQTGHKRWIDACECSAALAFWPLETLLAARWGDLPDLLRFGPQLWQRTQARARTAIATAYPMTVGPLRVLVVNQDHPSDIAEMAPEYDLVVGFHYYVDETPRLKLSCRSRPPLFSCRPFAENFGGGGGHDHSAGFSVVVGYGESRWHEQSPYELVRNLLRDYLGLPS